MPSDQPTRAHLRAATAMPLDADEARWFLQRRLEVATRFLFALWSLAWVSHLALFGLTSPQGIGPLLTHPPTWLHLGVVVTLGTSGGLLRARPFAPKALERMELALTSLQGAVAAVMMAHVPASYRPEGVYLLGLALVLVLRAATIPSTPRRTGIVGAVTLAPLLMATWSVYAQVATGGGLSVAASTLAGTAVAAGSAIATSVVVSRVVFGLRERARDALRLGQYELREKIGEGAMGVVYRAEHALLRRPTAIKLFAGHRHPDELARFEQEVQRTSELASPHVISVYDFGRTHDGVFYYAMEYMGGRDLQALLDLDGPQPQGRVVRLLRDVAEALAEAHEAGLMHGDVKPANVLLAPHGRRGELAKLADFGLVRALEGGLSGPAGTPQYMAPEAITQPTTADDRTDLYALGAVGYALLCGKPPFVGPVATVLAKQLSETPVRPSLVRGEPVSPRLEALIVACLAKGADDRPESAEAVIEALDALEDVVPWSEEDARAWWKARPEGPVAPAPVPAVPRTSTPPVRIVPRGR